MITHFKDSIQIIRKMAKFTPHGIGQASAKNRQSIGKVSSLYSGATDGARVLTWQSIIKLHWPNICPTSDS